MSENPLGADNQQERSKAFWRGYIVGLVDGEGCFHVALQTRSDLPLGISVIPEFHVAQHQASRLVLDLLVKELGCGYVKPNYRHSEDKTFVYVVRDRHDLLTKVIPFFEVNRLQTLKSQDFILFSKVVRLLDEGKHHSKEGISEIIDLAYQMNDGGRRRKKSSSEILCLLKSSETIR